MLWQANLQSILILFQVLVTWEVFVRANSSSWPDRKAGMAGMRNLLLQVSECHNIAISSQIISDMQEV